jgi:hypothetical protein
VSKNLKLANADSKADAVANGKLVHWLPKGIAVDGNMTIKYFFLDCQK